MNSTDRREQLLELLALSWIPYRDSKLHDFIVRPAIPILFFGDSAKYFASKLRVVTVGLNPSKAEFPDNQFVRFPRMRGREKSSRQEDGAQHLAALDEYFSKEPYKLWFGSYEPILEGLQSSYYDGQLNAALHTDLCSPIATSPTWSKLSKAQRPVLESDGVMLWHALMKCLEPDIIVISVAARYARQVSFRQVDRPKEIWRLPRQIPYSVLATPIKIADSKATLLVSGRAAQKPFGTISNTAKFELGAAVGGHYRDFTR